MKRIDRKTVVTASVAAFAALVALAALGAWFARQGLESQLEEGSALAKVRAARLMDTKAPASPVGEVSPGRWALSESADVAGTMQSLQQFGDASGVELGPVKVVTANTPGRQSFQVAGVGSAQQVCSFLAAVEQRERLVVVESCRVQAAPDGKVGFELGLVSFHAAGER